jgi:hypothetical protein
MQKVAMVVRVYNKPDSVIIRITNRERRREKLFLQIFNIIAASILLSISITKRRVITSRTCCIYVYDDRTGIVRLLYTKLSIKKAR